MTDRRERDDAREATRILQRKIASLEQAIHDMLEGQRKMLEGQQELRLTVERQARATRVEIRNIPSRHDSYYHGIGRGDSRFGALEG